MKRRRISVEDFEKDFDSALEKWFPDTPASELKLMSVPCSCDVLVVMESGCKCGAIDE